MINVSKFVKEHIPLCVCTLGLAVVGYLGYHAVRWILNKCQKTEKIEQVAIANINSANTIPINPVVSVGTLPTGASNQSSEFSNPPPNALVNRVEDIEVSPDKITMGQGEYIVFHKLPTGEKQPLSRETFDQVFKILLQHSPAALINNGARMEACVNRYELIKSKLKELDPTLEAVFVPRTLYELILIKKCIQEDLKHKEICIFLDPCLINNAKQGIVQRKKCWHLCSFKDVGNNEDTGVKTVAYRLNKAMYKAFTVTSEGFTCQELSVFAEKEIDFLKDYHKKFSDSMDRFRKGEKVEIIMSVGTPGPTTHFGYESSVPHGTIKPMGIRNDSDAQIIRNAIALECSKLAQHSLFLYKGGNFQYDSICYPEERYPTNLSYGSSLFAGCIFDGGATAFHFMRNKKNAYAVPIAFDQLNDSPFFIPRTHTVTQLFCHGETFHGRSLSWKGASWTYDDYLNTNQSKEELNSKFLAYKNKTLQLK